MPGAIIIIGNESEKGVLIPLFSFICLAKAQSRVIVPPSL